MDPKIKNNIGTDKYELILKDKRTSENQVKMNYLSLSPEVQYIMSKFFSSEDLTLNEYKVVRKVFMKLEKTEQGTSDFSDIDFKDNLEDELDNNYKETLKDIVKESTVSDNTLTWLQSIAEAERNTNKSVELGISFYQNGVENQVTLIVDMEKLKYEFISVNDIMVELVSTNTEFAKLINNNKDDKNNIKFSRIAVDKYLIKSRELLNNIAIFKGVSSNDLDYKKFWCNIDDNVILRIMDELKDLLNPSGIDSVDFFQPN